MSLTTCRECGKEVSDQAWQCPHCGAPMPGRTGWGIEWKSKTTLFGWPLVHVAFGFSRPFRPRVAKGIIAIGQFAVGVVTIAQVGLGLVFGLGQFIFAPAAVAQFAVTILAALGQFAIGWLAIGQIVLAHYGYGQTGAGTYLWTAHRHDPQAIAFFQQLFDTIRGYTN